jgi:hypothetical protein
MMRLNVSIALLLFAFVSTADASCNANCRRKCAASVGPSNYGSVSECIARRSALSSQAGGDRLEPGTSRAMRRGGSLSGE